MKWFDHVVIGLLLLIGIAGCGYVNQAYDALKCESCGGNGLCSWCGGKGSWLFGKCGDCKGNGRCPTCLGTGVHAHK